MDGCTITEGSTHRRAPVLGLILCCTVLKFLIIYEQGTSHFHVALGIENDVAALGWAFLFLFLFLFFGCFGSLLLRAGFL